jgi:hypothetical protein
MIDNTCYLFDDEGIILEPGWHDFRGDTYYLGKDGIIQRGTVEVDGVKYYFSTESGVFRTGLVNINGDEYYIRTEPVIIDAGLRDSITVYTSYNDSKDDIVKISPADLKKMFEIGLPIYYHYNRNSDKLCLITSATYYYDGEDLEGMDLIDAAGYVRLYVNFCDEADAPQEELAL